MRRYGRWGGNPNGTPEDKDRCIVSVDVPRALGFIPRQCRNKRVEDGLCRTHRAIRDRGGYLHIPEDEERPKKRR